MLPITSPYVKSYGGQTEWMYFLIEDDDLLGKYNTILIASLSKQIIFENQNKASW